MATLTIEIGSKGKKGRSVYFLLTHKKTKKRIPTLIKVEDSDLSTSGRKIKNPTKVRLIENMRRKLQDRLFEISIDLLGRDVDAAYIASRLIVHKGSIDFFGFTEEWLKHTKVTDKKNYRSMLSALEKHLGHRSLMFSDINYAMLKGFEEYMDDRPRAQCMYLGLMRHLYREAMLQYNTDNEVIIPNDPFTRYKVPRQKLKKGVRALSLEELMKIYNYNDGKPYSRASRARDIFIMSFCLMGMNSVDMFECDKMKDDAICYKRAKTRTRRSDEAYIEVMVHPFLLPYMKKYKGRKRIFNFYLKYADCSTFNGNINKGLKDVGKAVGIDNLQFYQARHTFATLSRNLMKFAKSDIDEALNHVGDMDIADVYIQKDFSIINENNFKLIDRVFGLG